MKYKSNWDETKERFQHWWNGTNTGRPLMKVVGKDPIEIPEEIKALTPEELYTNTDKITARYRFHCEHSEFLAEAFPNVNMDIGPGCMALYLGAEPEFAWDTVWYTEIIHDLMNYGKLSYDPENKWFKKHMDMAKALNDSAQGDYYVGIPDIIENIDIVAALRGSQNVLFDLMDTPEIIKEKIEEIDDLYFQYYDQYYELLKDKDGGACYTMFEIWGPGRTAKIQCDFSAMISPDQYREFILPSLKKQCKKLDYSLYHLDGPDAIRHLDAIMEIDDLKALQWTCGAGQPDGGSERWYGIYDKVTAAGKSLWIQLYEGGLSDWIESTQRLIDRYGTKALYIIYPDMSVKEAHELMEYAETNWGK